ncbi:MAG: Rrf2 family transcriptional regulator [Clostridia bacterium]|nr:Rrf2 family transcriptional regulator [Clostridia bacterium]MCR5694042.1 Rrf2 family transcriptional regulator [Clostridia bacterium]
MISTKGRYALRVMIDLAENNTGDFIPLKEIAERQEISKKYLEIIVKDLVTAKLVVGSSGKGGGYKLLRDASEYKVGEIIEATEGPIITVACLAGQTNECPRAAKCKTLPLWTEYDRMTHEYFFSKKLSDLL